MSRAAARSVATTIGTTAVAAAKLAAGCSVVLWCDVLRLRLRWIDGPGDSPCGSPDGSGPDGSGPEVDLVRAT